MKDERNGEKCLNTRRAELQGAASCHSRNIQLINGGLGNLPVSGIVGERKRRLYGSSGSGTDDRKVFFARKSDPRKSASLPPPKKHLLHD